MTVEITWPRKATSAISRLFFAMRMKRIFGAMPKPCSRCWLTVKRKLLLSTGFKLVKMLLVVMRELLKPTLMLVPVAKPWL